MTFTVNGLSWDMDYINEDDIKMNPDGDPYFGLTEYETQKIYIRSGLSKELTERTVLHELTHCFLFSYGSDNLETYSEEHVCNIVGAYAKKAIKICESFMKKHKIAEFDAA